MEWVDGEGGCVWACLTACKYAPYATHFVGIDRKQGRLVGGLKWMDGESECVWVFDCLQVCTSCHTRASMHLMPHNLCVRTHILLVLFDQSVPHSTSIQTCPMVSVCIQWRTPTRNSTASHVSAVADSWGGRDTSFPTVLYDICVLLMLFSAKQF